MQLKYNLCRNVVNFNYFESSSDVNCGTDTINQLKFIDAFNHRTDAFVKLQEVPTNMYQYFSFNIHCLLHFHTCIIIGIFELSASGMLCKPSIDVDL